jgi:hypothetical protein
MVVILQLHWQVLVADWRRLQQENSVLHKQLKSLQQAAQPPPGPGSSRAGRGVKQDEPRYVITHLDKHPFLFPILSLSPTANFILPENKTCMHCNLCRRLVVDVDLVQLLGKKYVASGGPPGCRAHLE